MADHPHLARSSSNLSQSHSASSSVRPRNRRPINADSDDANSHYDDQPRGSGSGLLSAFSPSTSRSVSPFPTAATSNSNNIPSRSAGGSPNRNTAGSTTGDLGQFFSETWTQSWSSVQDITTTFFSNVGQGKTLLNSNTGLASQPSSSRQSPRGRRPSLAGDRKPAASWGPAPPPKSKRPGPDDVAAGSLAEREAALKAAKTASVLESHDGVNGGLDVSGKHKRRNSDEVADNSTSRGEDDYLVYVHKVRPEDTYAGLILRYKCREDAFRRANGLWSRDTIQTRRWLTIPVAACDIRGRPCDPPADINNDNDNGNSKQDDVDLLSRTPESNGCHPPQTYHDDYFNKSTDEPSTSNKQDGEDDKPWTHLRWVKIDTIPEPVEIGRVARGTMGYFPPRRRRSIRTMSSVSTPRQSLDLPESVLDGGPSPRRPSSLSSRPQFSGTPTSSWSRIGSDAGDNRPAWMKRPGGVGTMGRNARAPGPDKDVLNTWTRKHIPGLNIEGMPSMAITGSELAKLGFQSDPNIAQTAYEDTARRQQQQSNGFDRAASTVETWVRGAWAKRPGTPLLRPLGGGDRVDGTTDLIELTDTTSDDGRDSRQPPGPGNLIRSVSMGATSLEGDEMPICIECRYPVKTLWTSYSAAGDKSSGHNIRLTVCKRCGRFCDKYVEHDFVVLFIDLVLIKPQVYRHLLHNSLMRDGDRFDPSIIRLGVLLLLFDVYLTWARIEKQAQPDFFPPGQSNLGKLAQQPIVFQYLFFLTLCASSTVAFHASIRFLTSSPWSPLAVLGVLPRYTRPNSVSTALLVSSSTKLFPILMVIWEYDVPAAARLLGWAVVANNVEALRILLDCKYYAACVLAVAGAAARWAMGRLVLITAGLGHVDSIGGGSMAADGRALWGLVMYAKQWAGRLAVG
ncbi:lipid intermediate transporter [Geosmithia morbida]|uniref:Protein ARV n=1 Tax=Geosmithia morbida TaxID=1094350 RepID=A0A9P4Z0Q8_9HYPO|nr:lipid intermediate transporter [Geosmithia morbida]KAF4125304.1 lipid intermediate transporter [Geosmithia morbida]